MPISEKPLLFSAPMVLALLRGMKTQTRRALKPQPTEDIGLLTLAENPVRFAVGDKIYVKERVKQWISGGNPLMAYVKFEADGRETLIRWPAHWNKAAKPPMFMPKDMSRITLVVTDVRVQRLQDITEEDAEAEGLSWEEGDGFFVAGFDAQAPTPKEMYALLWDHINGPGAWAQNPWVVAITFDVHKRNLKKF